MYISGRHLILEIKEQWDQSDFHLPKSSLRSSGTFFFLTKLRNTPHLFTQLLISTPYVSALKCLNVLALIQSPVLCGLKATAITSHLHFPFTPPLNIQAPTCQPKQVFCFWYYIVSTDVLGLSSEMLTVVIKLAFWGLNASGVTQVVFFF